MKAIQALIKKEILLEYRRKYAFYGLILYIVSTIFVAFLAFGNAITMQTWNALFWVIMIFSAITAVSKSFSQESIARQLYYYSIASPFSIIAAKMIYNLIFTIILALISLMIYILFLGDFIQNHTLFIVSMLFGMAGFSAVLTMISAISSRAGNNSTLMAVLSFPLVLPLLLNLMKLTDMALTGERFVMGLPYLLLLALIGVITAALAFILFPYLWKE